jgi:protein-disulfide isomerase
MNKVMMSAAALFVLFGLVAPGATRAVDQMCPDCLGGYPDAPIRIEVFSDFQCPACRQLYISTMRFVLQDYAAVDKVCVIYHEFPLAMHQYSREASRFSLAAQRLGRQQWAAVVDALYMNQEIWAQDGKLQVFIASALSPADYQKVLKLKDDPSINEAMEEDIGLGRERKVESTPTLFVTAQKREQKVAGVIPYLTLKNFFDSIVK